MLYMDPMGWFYCQFCEKNSPFLCMTYVDLTCTPYALLTVERTDWVWGCFMCQCVIRLSPLFHSIEFKVIHIFFEKKAGARLAWRDPYVFEGICTLFTHISKKKIHHPSMDRYMPSSHGSPPGPNGERSCTKRAKPAPHAISFAWLAESSESCKPTSIASRFCLETGRTWKLCVNTVTVIGPKNVVKGLIQLGFGLVFLLRS